jgi:hypothetical protein
MLYSKRLAILLLLALSLGGAAAAYADEKNQIGYVATHWSTMRADEILLYSAYVAGVRDTYASFNVARRKGVEAERCVTSQREVELLAEEVRSYKKFHSTGAGSTLLRDWTIFRLNEICDLGGDF